MDLILPDWPAPARVRAAFTTRQGGVSTGPYASLNLGIHVEDDPHAVAENRARVRHALALPREPAWLRQVHGTQVLPLGPAPLKEGAEADASVSREAGPVCAIQVADCLPVLLASEDGAVIGAAHAGWRGLAAGVLEATVGAMAAAPQRLLAWLGPAIGPEAFEVGEEVRAAFLAHDPAARQAFQENPRGRWQADLCQLARQRLQALGITRIHGGEWCTATDAGRFFSYRRDGRCGRMAALIWLTS